MRFAVATLFSALCLAPGAACAAWIEASSEHFVVYANDAERDVRRFADQLERYHSALSVVSRVAIEAPSPSNRVTVFVVRNEAQVQRLAGAGHRNIGGFYVPRAGGSVAIIPQVDSKEGTADWSMIVLLHEYAHHFLITSSAVAMPRWASEGSAEFFSSASFEADGGVGLGRPAQHRAAELYLAREVKAGDLLDPTEYDRRKSRSYDAFYGKSWLLYHYLTFEPTRQGQLQRYYKLLLDGKPLREAGIEAFGDFVKLEKELDAYLRRPRVNMIKLPASMLKTSAISLRTLSEGEAAMMPLRIRSRRGTTPAQAGEIVAEARTVAARYPKDAAVLTALAEAEYDAGDPKAAITAADAALKIDPAQENAYIQKGYALFRLAAGAEDKDAAFKRARAPFVTLNHREPDHPLPLLYFYRSYVFQGKTPTPLAIDGLVRAVTVAPFDFNLRMEAGLALIPLGRMAEVRYAMLPVATAPHGGLRAEAAKRILARIDADPSWRGEGVDALLADAAASGEQKSDGDTAP